MSKLTHYDYMKRLCLLNNQMKSLYSKLWRGHFKGIRQDLYNHGWEQLEGAFERTYRNYSAWCRKHHEENLWHYYLYYPNDEKMEIVSILREEFNYG